MATNEILKFAETNTGTNLLTQAEYLADAQRPIGNQPGVARSKLVNKALRQSSLIAAAVAQFIADNQANNVVDTANPADVADWIEAVVRSIGIPTAVAGGTADAITADFTPNVALTNGTTVIVRAGSANTTTATTFAPDGLTAKTIVKGNNLALAAGDIAGAGHWLEMNFDTALDKWVLQNPTYGINGGLLRVTVFTSSGTWTKGAGTKSIEVEVVGGGGSGGGCVATGAGQFSTSSGGGGGGYGRLFIASPASPETVTVGAGGVGVLGGTGGAGGTSSFGSLVSATGGLQGGNSVATGSTTYVSPGTGGGFTSSAGSEGGSGGSSWSIAPTNGMGGFGGNSALAGTAFPGLNATGQAGRLYGGGGAGSQNGPSLPANVGANGAAGVVIVKEYA